MTEVTRPTAVRPPAVSWLVGTMIMPVRSRCRSRGSQTSRDIRRLAAMICRTARASRAAIPATLRGVSSRHGRATSPSGARPTATAAAMPAPNSSCSAVRVQVSRTQIAYDQQNNGSTRRVSTRIQATARAAQFSMVGPSGSGSAWPVTPGATRSTQAGSSKRSAARQRRLREGQGGADGQALVRGARGEGQAGQAGRGGQGDRKRGKRAGRYGQLARQQRQHGQVSSGGTEAGDPRDGRAAARPDRQPAGEAAGGGEPEQGGPGRGHDHDDDGV